MNYTVLWKPSLKQRLAEIWLESDDRNAVASAANTIDVLLRIAPFDQGESRSGLTRIFIVHPLAVVYDVFDDDRRVDVLAVRDITKRKE